MCMLKEIPMFDDNNVLLSPFLRIKKLVFTPTMLHYKGNELYLYVNSNCVV